MKAKTKAKSTVIFILVIALIGILSYAGTVGITGFGYRFKPFSETINKGLDLQGGISVLEEIDENNVDEKLIERTIQLISTRVNRMGVAETVVTREGKKRIRIEIPGKFDAKEVTDTVAKTGELKFVGPDKQVILTGKDVKNASAYLNQDDQKPVVSLEFNEEGTKKFAEATKKFVGQRIAIYMDEKQLTDPQVDEPIPGGKAIIRGSKSLQEAKTQANMIQSGALPVKVKAVLVKEIGASLGANSLPLSIKAGEIGIGLVLLFMILYYRLPGVIASIALILYTWLVLAAFSMAGVTLTLAGIAGFLLTVGMAVDANILIFERTKEELKSGKSIKAAIDVGFHRAMTSILDSNITSILSGLVLYGVGTGSVKGFALTLIIGVSLSMFTAITVTKTLMNLVADMGWFKHKWTIGTFGVHDFRKGVK